MHVAAWRRGSWLGLGATALPARALAAQALPDDRPGTPTLPSSGLSGFSDIPFLTSAVVALSLAAALAWLVGRVSRRRRAADTIEEAEAPKLYVVYAVVGALTGLIVLKYGSVVGFVIFGIGGLLRFRTQTASTPGTGRLILVTLIGLTCGLELPHLALLATAFALLLVAVLDTGASYRLVVRGLAPGTVAHAADAYRTVLAAHECRVVGEKQSAAKDQVAFLLYAPHRVAPDTLAHAIDTEVPPTLRGAVDWETG